MDGCLRPAGRPEEARGVRRLSRGGPDPPDPPPVISPASPRFAEAVFPAARAIRSAGGMVAAPSSANIDFPFLQELFELGLGDVSDYLTVHPYRADAPETFNFFSMQTESRR